MRVLVFLLFSFAASGQIPLWQLEYAADSNYVIGALPTGEPVWVLKSSVANPDSIYLNTGSDTIRLRDGSGYVLMEDIYTAIGFDGIEVEGDCISGVGTHEDPLVFSGDCDITNENQALSIVNIGGKVIRLLNSIDGTSAGSYEIIDGYGINSIVVAGTSLTTEVDTNEVATPYDLTLLTTGATQYINPYIVSGDTIGFYLTVAHDTVCFSGVTVDPESGSCCNDTSVTNELQLLTIDSISRIFTLSLSDGNSVSWEDQTGVSSVAWGDITSIPSGFADGTDDVNDADSDPNNEIELPSQSGNSGKYLTTNGASPSWATVSGGGGSEYAQLHNTSSDVPLTDPTTSYTLNFNNCTDNNLNVNCSGNTITVTAAGYYKIEWGCSVDPLVNTTANLLINSSSGGDLTSFQRTFYSPSGKYVSIGGSMIRNCGASEAFTVKVTTSGNIYGSTISTPYFIITKL